MTIGVMSTPDADRSKRVGATIRRRRQALGWEQRELAERVGVHVNSVQKWESGTHYPGRKLGKLEAVLGIRVDDGPGDPAMPTPEELEDLRAHIREVLGSEKGSVLEAAMDAALADKTRRGRDASSAPSAADRRTSRAS